MKVVLIKEERIPTGTGAFTRINVEPDCATETIEPIADNDTTPKTTKQTKKILLFIR